MTEYLWILLTILSILALLANLASLVQGLRLRGHVARGQRIAMGGFHPRAAILLPVRGLDDGFDANLRSILSQDYPAYRVLLVADDAGDPALESARRVALELPRVPLTPILADPGGLPGKANALRTALHHLAPGDEVVVLADADIRPGADWLHQLVQPLADANVAAATGFRWYVPPEPRFWSLVRSEWDAVGGNVLFDSRRNYVWGGSTAIRAETLRELRMDERWRSVLSDDLVMTGALRGAGLKIEYAPAALVPTFEGCDRRGCLEWCWRQMTMAVLYQPHLQRFAAMAFAVFNGSVLLGLASIGLAIPFGPLFLVPAALFLVTLPATIAKAAIRRRAFLGASPHVAAAWRRPAVLAALAALAVPWVMMAGLLRTRRPSVVEWRGRRYDVRDPTAVRLLDGPR